MRYFVDCCTVSASQEVETLHSALLALTISLVTAITCKTKAAAFLIIPRTIGFSLVSSVELLV